MTIKPPIIGAALLGLLASSAPAFAQAPANPEPPAGAPPAGAPPAAPPVVEVPPAAPVIVTNAPVVVAPAAPAPEFLAGVSNQNMFLRSPDDMFVFFPNGRLQTDGYFFKSQNSGLPKDSFFVKRARLELAGWVDKIVYFQIGADFATGAPATPFPVPQSQLNTTDDFVAIAPWEDLAILQFGQFDAPFTMENRTSDKYFDFMERSLTVRAFGIPTNKEMGFMLHGTNNDRNFYYSLAVLNGDGQNFKNVDNNFDVMGRAWIAPLSFLGPNIAHDITLGGSGWTGNRTFADPLSTQTTAGGYQILSFGLPKLPNGDTQQTNQQGRLHAWALEVNAPIMHKYGVRWELVHKNQPLSAIDTTTSTTSSEVITAGMRLKGWSQYFEAWAWLMGDDRIVGEPGLQLPTRFKKFGVKPPQHGLMVAARLELLDETFSADDAALAPLVAKGSGVGKTKLTSYALGVNYWISKRFRTSFNWVLNHFNDRNDADTASYVKGLKSANEQEFSFRLAIAL
jgi:phosphate-selective porin